MRQFMIFLALFGFVLADVLYAGEISGAKEQMLNTKQVSFQRERDPFGLSAELLKKTMSERYVSFTGKGLNSFNLPRIEITGVMLVGDKTMATAKIESLGNVVLKPNDKMLITSASGRKRYNSFIVKRITPSELVILVEGGYEIHGKFR